jgi:hypothetical protein
VFQAGEVPVYRTHWVRLSEHMLDPAARDT